jgi:hypothetical protein
MATFHRTLAKHNTPDVKARSRTGGSITLPAVGSLDAGHCLGNRAASQARRRRGSKPSFTQDWRPPGRRVITPTQKRCLIDQHPGADQRLKELIDQFGGCLTGVNRNSLNGNLADPTVFGPKEAHRWGCPNGECADQLLLSVKYR